MLVFSWRAFCGSRWRKNGSSVNREVGSRRGEDYGRTSTETVIVKRFNKFNK